MALFFNMASLSVSLMIALGSGAWTPPPIVTVPPPVLPSVSVPPSTIEWTPPKPVAYTAPTMPPLATLAPLLGVTTIAPFDCDIVNLNSSSNASANLSGNITHDWSDEKKKWCCEHERRGCTTITSTSTITITSTVTRTTSTSTTVTLTDTIEITSTETSTTTIDGCGLTFCSMKESPGGNATNGTCREHIHNLSFHMFLGDDHSCSRARDFVLGSCDQCSICPPELAGCGVLDYPPTTTTTAGPCQADCTFEGQTATCGARIKWASTHKPLRGQPDACPRAHALVKTQCSACEQCTLDMAGAGCTASQTSEAEDAYDCQAQLRHQASTWSADKKSWCCTHKKVGCDDTEAVRVLITDYDQDSHDSGALSSATWSRRVIVGVSSVGFITFAAVFTVINRRPARMHSDGYTREVEIKSFEEALAE